MLYINHWTGLLKLTTGIDQWTDSFYTNNDSQALEKSEGVPGAHCLRMHGSPGFYGELGSFRKIGLSVNFSVWKMPAIDHALSKQ